MRIEYDLSKLREDPQKIERWETQRSEPLDITQAAAATEYWGKIKNPYNKHYKQYTPRTISTRKTKHLNGQKSQTMEYTDRMGGNAETHRRKD